MVLAFGRSKGIAVGTSFVLLMGLATAASSQTVKGQNIRSLLSTGGGASFQAKHAAAPTGRSAFALLAPDAGDDGLIPPSLLGSDPGPNPAGGEVSGSGSGSGSRFKNIFVNDPCSDPSPYAPFPSNYFGVMQSETEIAVLNRVRGEEDTDESGPSGRLMVAGFNDSLGFYNNRSGLSGFAYSTTRGKNWIDGDGLPPVGPSDRYYGDPVVVVHHKSKTFYYASIYQTPEGLTTLSVNRGHFMVAPAQGQESRSNTRCANDSSQFGVPDPPATVRERIIWEPPVAAVAPPFLGDVASDQRDFLDKEWLTVDQKTGFLYLTYTRFATSGATPLELVRSFDGGRTWTPPTIIVPNLDDTFNTATQPIVTPTGRLVVTWFSQTFDVVHPPYPVLSERIESAYSDDGGDTFTTRTTVASVNPQGEPRGYNRGRSELLNAPYIAADRGINDGSEGNYGRDGARSGEQNDRGPDYGNIYITYFDGKTPLPGVSKAADIRLSVSTDDGVTYHPKVTVNTDATLTSHVFPSVQTNKHGTVFVTWIDRRVDPQNNVLNDTWAAFSHSAGNVFPGNVRVTDVSTDWFARADARPNFGDYNSSEVIDFDQFVSIWSDARFPLGTFQRGTVTLRAATPDTLFANVGNGSDVDDGTDNEQ